MTDCITEVESVRPAVEVGLEASAPAPDVLMVEWLNDALYRFDADGLVFARADVVLEPEGSGWRLRARAHGERFDPARHPHEVLIKAATYHALAVETDEDGWWARIVFDI